METVKNTSLVITLSGSDADGDTLTFSVIASPANGILSGTAPDLSYTPNTDYVGGDNFTYTVNDGTENSAEATVSITVNPVFSIGGTVTGLENTGLFLENNGGDTLEVAGVSFEFPTQLADGDDYRVTVADHPQHQLCSAGNAVGTVAGDHVKDVSVLCRYWRLPAMIETDDAGDAYYPQIAFDSSGNAIAVWYQSDGILPSIWAKTYTPDSGWGTATLIETDNAGAATKPKIAVDSSGNAIAVWTQSSGMRINILANTYTPDSGWGMATLIETDDAGHADNPQIAFDSTGNAIAVWSQGDGTRYNIWANIYTPDSGWGTATLIETDNAGDADNPQIAFDSTGNAIAVWQQYDGARHNIWANTYSPDSGWGTATLIETDDAGSAHDPQVAFDNAGNAIAVWYQYGDAGSKIQANKWSQGSGWGTATLIDSGPGGDAYTPQIAFDSTGNAIAVWSQNDGQLNIRANTYTPDSGWGTATLIETDNAGDAYTPQIAFDSTGNAIAVWSQDDGTRYNIWANTYTPDSGWGTAALIETDNAGDASAPKIAFDTAGNAIAVWHQDDGTRYNIWANQF